MKGTTVYVLLGQMGQCYGVFTTERRAQARLEALARDGVYCTISEQVLNGIEYNA